MLIPISILVHGIDHTYSISTFATRAQLKAWQGDGLDAFEDLSRETVDVNRQVDEIDQVVVREPNDKIDFCLELWQNKN